MKVIIAKDYEEMSRIAADIVAEEVNNKPDCVLGLATGSTPVGMYKKLVEYYIDNKVDFARVKSFNLDEYIGLSGESPQSYRYFMENNLFNHINIDKNNINIPQGNVEDIDEECSSYDKRIIEAGGIDLQVLGIGSNGHIGFNEPSDTLMVMTHKTNLKQDTIEANSRFFNDIKEVPTAAITMGMGSIMKAKKIVLLANGSAKAEIISKLIEGKINTNIPASLLQIHRDVIVIVDEEAGSLLKKKVYQSSNEAQREDGIKLFSLRSLNNETAMMLI